MQHRSCCGHEQSVPRRHRTSRWQCHCLPTCHANGAQCHALRDPHSSMTACAAALTCGWRRGRTAPTWALSPWCSPAAACGLSSCASLSCAARALPIQKLASTVTNISSAVSHVRGTCRFEPLWSRHFMNSYLGKRMVEVHRVDVKNMVHVASHELSYYRLSVR